MSYFAAESWSSELSEAVRILLFRSRDQGRGSQQPSPLSVLPIPYLGDAKASQFPKVDSFFHGACTNSLSPFWFQALPLESSLLNSRRWRKEAVEEGAGLEALLKGGGRSSPKLRCVGGGTHIPDHVAFHPPF